MTNIHIVGKPRSGKGVLMTYLTLINGENPVDANFHIFNLKNFTHINFYQLISFLKKPRQEPEHLIDIDELPGWCDSYVPGEKGSRFATHFLNQAQKLGYDLIFTSQRRMRANINFRELSDIAFKAEKYQYCSLKKCLGLTCPYQKDFDNVSLLDTCHFCYKVLDPNNTEEDIETGKKITIPFRLALDEVFLRFDTWEAVPPVGLDDVLVEMQKYDPQALNADINRQISILKEAYPTIQPRTVSETTDLLLEVREHTRHAAVVYARLLRQSRHSLLPKIQTEKPPIAAQHPAADWREKWLTTQSQRTTKTN